MGASPALFAGPLPGTGGGDVSQSVVAWARAMEPQTQSSLGVCGGAHLLPA